MQTTIVVERANYSFFFHKYLLSDLSTLGSIQEPVRIVPSPKILSFFLSQQITAFSSIRHAELIYPRATQIKQAKVIRSSTN